MSRFIAIFFHSLFLQSLWNYDRMQNIGFVFSIIPWLKFLYKNNIEKIYDRIKAHLGFFNTHPYLASILIGITMKLEEEYAQEKISSDEIIRTKTMLAGPIAAIGDRLIWSTWRIFCSVLVVSYFLLFGKNFYIESNISLGIIIFLLIYNLIGHLPLRFFGIYWGYYHSRDIVTSLSKFKLQNISEVLNKSSVILLTLSSFIYSISLVDNMKLLLLFWFNIILVILLSRKISKITVILIFLFLNFIIFNFFKI